MYIWYYSQDYFHIFTPPMKLRTGYKGFILAAFTCLFILFSFSAKAQYVSPKVKLEAAENTISKLSEAIKERDKVIHDQKYLLEKKDREILTVQNSVKRLEINTAKMKEASKHQDSFLNVFLLAALLALVAVAILFVTLKDKKSLFKKLEEKTAIINKGAEDLQQKNKEVTDSIKYARKIQDVMLPTINEMKAKLPKSFVFYKPKDIVSGDFFWITEVNQKVFFATADCTGHGVPGALMSMLGISRLNEIVNEKDILSPAKILNELKSSIINSLSKTESGAGMQDGMDISLFCYDKRKMKLTYAAANNGIYIIREDKIISLEADKQPVGTSPREHMPFKESSFDLMESDLIVTYTDGFADQFGGPKGKKFKYKQLQQLLMEVKNKPVSVIPELMNRVFLKWKGKLEQVDDVLIVGVRI
ncbi:MAG: SpoIIE family protein phosphatase [Bacteroidia bacterium]|nr:SpoIIE family protein phosphatase [Bacteroidia bacterium]